MEWEGREAAQVLAWTPEFVEDEKSLDEGIACARRLGTLLGMRDVTLAHSWVLFHDEWDYELITSEQAGDAEELDAGAVILGTLLVRSH
jgi:hypothetical protein